MKKQVKKPTAVKNEVEKLQPLMSGAYADEKIGNPIKYFFVEPLQKFKEKDYAFLWRFSFAVLATLSLVAMLCMSRNAGMSGDEHIHLEHAKNVYSYYATFGEDSTAVTVTPKYNLPYYGQSFDNIVYAVGEWINTDDPYGFRHFCNSMFGWLAMLFAGLLAFRIAGWRAAVFTLALIFLSPRFVGHSLNNLKDLPLATASVLALYYIVRFFQLFPKLTKWVAVMLGFTIGLAISIRIGGFILVAYFGLYALIYYFYTYRKQGLFEQRSAQDFWKMFRWGLLIAVGGYVLALLLWPYALVSPVKHSLETFASMSKFALAIRQNFEGAMQWSSELPWYYTPKFILITIPVAVILGIAVYPFAGGLKKLNRFETFMVYFAFIFPIFWIVYTKANVYGGWRHSIFAYPPMVVAAGLGFNALVELTKSRWAKYAYTCLPFVMLILPAAFIVKNHPYEYTFFNQLAGGIKDAYGTYEMDYYYHSTREASEWIIADVKKNGAPDSTQKTRVVTWHAPSVSHFFSKDTADFSVGFARWNERGYSDWDYAVFTITGMNPELLKSKKAFPPKNTAYQVKVDGVPICIVLKREDKSDFYGHRAMQQRDYASAVPLLKKALAYDSYNEQALTDLGSIYYQSGMLDSAFALAQGWVTFNRGNTIALNQLANVYLAKGDFSRAIVTANAINKYNNRDISGLWVIANAQAQQGLQNEALYTLQRLLRIRGDFKPAYQLMAQIYDRAGNKQRAQQILDAVNALP